MYKQVTPLPVSAPKSFDSREFENPGHENRITYSWSWNVELSREEMMRQMNDMVDGGITNVYVIPTPPEFRPEFAPTTMSPPYLSDEFMEMTRFMVDYGMSIGIHFWLYDEGGWPSGSANGMTCEGRPDLVGRILKRESRQLKAGELYVPREDAVAAFSADQKRLPEGYVAEKDEEICEYFTFVPRYFNNLYPDLLNPEATERFIGLTHERYKTILSDEFGKAIPYMFTDEPAVHGPQWTIGANEDFKQKYGYDLVDYLPILFDKEDVSEKEMQVRMDYQDWWSRLFAENYLGQLQSWCRENNLKSVGHMGGDDETKGSGIYGYGHIMRALRKLDVPGIDAILGQILPAEPGKAYYQYADIFKPTATNHFFPRFASSAANQIGSRETLTETFGVYSPSVSCEEMRYVIGFQMVRGINKVNSQGLGYGRKGAFAHSDAVHCVPNDPSYYNRKELLKSIARQCYLISLGDPDIQIGLYLPVRDMWASAKLMNRACDLFDRIGVALEAMPCEFDVVDDDFLTQAECSNGALHMGLAHYRTILVPDCYMMAETSVKVLEAFIEDGGKVLVVCEACSCENVAASLSSGVKVCGAKALTIEELADEVMPAVKILSLEVEGKRPPVHENDPSLRVHKRKLPEGTLYYIFNEGLAARSFTLELSHTENCYRADVMDGKLYTLTGTPLLRISDGKCQVDGRLQCGEGLNLFFTEQEMEACAEQSFRIAEPEPVLELKEFTAAKTMEMTMTSDEVFTKACKEAPVAIPLGDWSDIYGKDFSGRVTYETSFRHPKNCGPEDLLLLDLGMVKHTCEIWLNGRKQGVLCTSPYCCVLKNEDLKEENVLEIKVANTNANQHVYNDCMKKWDFKQIGPYYQFSVELAKADLPSGLFGPVTLAVI